MPYSLRSFAVLLKSASLVSEACGSAFTDRREVVEKLATLWANGKKASVIEGIYRAKTLLYI